MIARSQPVAAAEGLLPRRGRIVGRRGRNAIRWTAIAALVAAGYVALAPLALGGSTSYVIADGTSMLPTLESGDLVILRAAATYEPGDLIAFHSRLLDRIVIHRIVDIEGNRFVTRGDGNDWIDADRPVQSDVLGKRWFRVPGVGRMFGLLQRPWIAALSAAVVAYLLWGGKDRNDAAFDAGQGHEAAS